MFLAGHVFCLLTALKIVIVLIGIYCMLLARCLPGLGRIVQTKTKKTFEQLASNDRQSAFYLLPFTSLFTEKEMENQTCVSRQELCLARLSFSCISATDRKQDLT